MKADFRVRALPLLAGAGLALGLAACTQTTYGTGTNAGLQTINDFSQAASILGPAKTPIDFSPRPPIVAPPSGASLPTPGSAPPPAALASNWPVDPDQQAAQQKAAIIAAQANGTPIKIKPLNGPSQPAPEVDPTDPYNVKTTPEQAAEYKRLAAAANTVPVDANGNPVRVYLTDPPATYLAADPSAPAPTDATAAAPAKKPLFKWPWQWFQKG